MTTCSFYLQPFYNDYDGEALLNAYGENMGQRFARIIHVLTSLPGADRLVWRHVGRVCAEPTESGLWVSVKK